MLLGVVPKREAAKEYSPRRKPWDSAQKSASPEGAKETMHLRAKQ
jgi:hypothetical protein